jgi:hypothetical protein
MVAVFNVHALMRCLPTACLAFTTVAAQHACPTYVPPAAARTTTTTVDDRPSPLTRPQLNAVIELLDAGADPNAEVGKHGMVRGPHSEHSLKTLIHASPCMLHGVIAV